MFCRAWVWMLCSVWILAGRDYRVYRAGNSRDVVTEVEAGFVFMGGGGDVQEAFDWLIDRSGGGDFVILRADRPDRRFNYYDWIYSELGGVDSAETIHIKNRAGANANEVRDLVMRAEAIFIAGGNQNTYLEDWAGTQLAAALNDCVARGVPIGGTSAGMHLMCARVYDGRNNSSYGYEALKDPYNFRMTFTPGFLNVPHVDGLTTETHFYERDRMGRAMAFAARLVEDGWSDYGRVLAVDEGTAFVMDENGYGYVLGDGYVYFLETTSPPSVCTPGQPLTIDDVWVYRIRDDFSQWFDLSNFSGSGGLAYWLDADGGTLVSSRGSVY